MVLPLSLLAAAGTLASRASTLDGALLAMALVIVALLAAIGRLTQDPIEVRVPRDGRRRR